MNTRHLRRTYKVLRRDTSYELEHEINELGKDGWQVDKFAVTPQCASFVVILYKVIRWED